MLKAYLYEGLRTPFGRHAGALARVRPDDLLESFGRYAKAIGALFRALSSAASENAWLLGLGAATLLTIILIVSMVTRRKRSTQHATFLY